MNEAAAKAFDSVFEYRLLENATREIRLLDLSPELATTPNHEQILQGTIRHCSLDTSPVYAALSYTWGDPHDTTPMLIDGKCHQITRNLAAFLVRITETSRNRNALHTDPFWIDAICINQVDNAEKSQQVHIMGNIFLKASKVFIWLGPASEDSHFAIDFLHEISRLKDQSLEVEDKDSFTVQSSHPFDSWLLSLEGRHEETLGPLLALVSRPWWSRAWVQQEVAMTPIHKTIVMCGKSEVRWGTVLDAFMRLGDLFDTTSTDVIYSLQKVTTAGVAPAVPMLRDIGVRMHMCFMSRPKMPGRKRHATYTLVDRLIFNAVASSNRVESTLLVDIVYSIIGIFMNSNKAISSIKADYSKSPEEVFTQVASCLYADYGLITLGLCGNASSVGLKLPSWVPDWSVRWERESYSWATQSVTELRKSSEGLYGASGQGNKFAYHLYEGILHLSGVKVDVLTSDGAYIGNFQELEDGDDFSWLAAYLEATQQEETAWPADSLWRLPIADQGFADDHHNRRTRAPSSMQDGYRDLMEHFAKGNLNNEVGSTARKYLWTMCTRGRRPFKSTDGFIGVGPTDMQLGDQVFIILGHEVPMILRDVGDGQYRIIGEAYVDGIMDGEYMKRDPPVGKLMIV